jgi:hypothetical protein
MLGIRLLTVIRTPCALHRDGRDAEVVTLLISPNPRNSPGAGWNPHDAMNVPATEAHTIITDPECAIDVSDPIPYIISRW